MNPHAGMATVDHELLYAGDHALFRKLVREMSPRLLHLVRNYARDDAHAADLLQASWIHIYQKRARFSGTGSFLGWALAVCRNVCRMEARKGRGVRPVRLDDIGDLQDSGSGPAEVHIHRQQAAALYAALERLTARERDAIVLRIIEGRKTAEVAHILDVKEASVRSLVHRGLKKLRRMSGLAERIQ